MNSAAETLKRLFGKEIHAPQQGLYDYLTARGSLPVRVEVKYFNILHRSAYIHMPLERFVKFADEKPFLFYLMTNHGNIFISAIQVYERAHVHTIQGGPVIVLRARVDNKGILRLTEPQACQLCHGSIRNFINEPTTENFAGN